MWGTENREKTNNYFFNTAYKGTYFPMNIKYTLLLQTSAAGQSMTERFT